MPYIITGDRSATFIRDKYNSSTQRVQSEAKQKPGLMRLQRCESTTCSDLQSPSNLRTHRRSRQESSTSVSKPSNSRVTVIAYIFGAFGNIGETAGSSDI